MAVTQLCCHEDRYKVEFGDNEWSYKDQKTTSSIIDIDLIGKSHNELTIYKVKQEGDLVKVFS